VFLIIAYFYSSTELEKSAEEFLPESEGEEGQEGEVIQTMYADVNKKIIKF
jgi:hypothetical protein